jgi:hypothetical protein
MNSMVFGKLMDREQPVVACKGCNANIPAGVTEIPVFKSIVVECPLCKSKRQYLPSEVFRGRVNHKLKARNIS